MTKTLYADIISEDKSIAIVTTKLSISYNLAIMDRWDRQSAIYSAGKYICIHLINNNELNMCFLDFRANPENVNLFLESSEPSDEIKQKFKSIVELVNSQYEQVKNNYIIVAGESPARELNPDY